MAEDSLSSVLEHYALNLYLYQIGRDSPSQARNLVLVIVTLIAAGTFQAGVNPPGGFWQDNMDGHVAGMSILASQNPRSYRGFLILNTFALSISTTIIIIFTGRFPLKYEIWAACLFMLATYASSVVASTPPEMGKVLIILVIALVPLIIRSSTTLKELVENGGFQQRSQRNKSRDEDDDIVLYGNDLRRVIRKYAYGDQPDVGGGRGGYNEGDRQARDVVLTGEDLRRIIGRLKQGAESIRPENEPARDGVVVVA